MVVTGAICAKSENPCIRWPVLYLNPAADLCWIMVTLVYGQDWCDADHETAHNMALTLVHIVVIVAFIIMVMVGVYLGGFRSCRNSVN